ncbi:MAG TPA: hypothetical protein VMU81_00190 [Acetobacteraceae bacterium]|nr:hypothetical protein [Acetobacteraceae bacterium]
MPTNIAALLYVVSTLLEFGRHLAATLERRAAARGFSMIASLFGNGPLPVIRAHLHRGILRATALETMLHNRAAAGCDVAMSNPCALSGRIVNAEDDPETGSFNSQTARMVAERAAHDAPIDPGNPPSLARIEAEVRSRPIGRTIADICRDLGVIPFLCTRTFWDAAFRAMVCYESSDLNCS